MLRLQQDVAEASRRRRYRVTNIRAYGQLEGRASSGSQLMLRLSLQARVDRGEQLVAGNDPPFPERSKKPMEPMKPMKPMEPMKPMQAPERWWPENLGEHPSSAGGQNATRYAFFADKQRLAVDTGDGNVKLYDTADHRISGVQQSQGGGGSKLTFTSQHGEVDLATLKPG